MSLRDRLITIKPREVSGPRSANRFDFQKSWALCRLIDLHKSGADYVIVMDYHDDVLVLDSSTDPKQIDFYQIKTKDTGPWTKGDLLKRKIGKKKGLLSPLGKLVDHKLRFANDVHALHFVSNQAFKLTLKGAEADVVQNVCLKELDEKELAEILAKLKSEHSLPDNPDCINCTNFSVTSLSIGGHAEHAMGVLGTYLGELYPDGKVLLPAIYRALCDEIKRKTNLEGLPSTFDELCSTRTIQRDEFQKFLMDVKPATEMNQQIALFTSQLQSEGYGFDEILQIQNAVRKLEIERMNKSDVILQRARTSIRKVVESFRNTNQLKPKLSDSLTDLRDATQRSTAVMVRIKGEACRTAMILMELYGI
jgi:hypothetical protein